MRKGPLIGVSLVVSLFLVVGGSQAQSGGRATTAWHGGFETGDLSQWRPAQVRGSSRIAIQSAIVREGRYAARVEVRSGDNDVAGSGSGERAHLWIDHSKTGAAEGQEQYWAWSTYFPADFDAPMGGWNSFVSFHHTGTTGQVNVQFAVHDRSTINLRVLGGDLSRPVRKEFALARLQRGRWYDFVLHVKWSSSRSGFVEVWLNKRRVVQKRQTPTLYRGQGVYLKQGYYRSAYSDTTVVYHDGMRRGSHLAEVADWARAFEPR